MHVCLPYYNFYELHINVWHNVFMPLIYHLIYMMQLLQHVSLIDPAVVESDIDNDAVAKVSFFYLLIVISLNVGNIICVLVSIILYYIFFS